MNQKTALKIAMRKGALSMIEKLIGMLEANQSHLEKEIESLENGDDSEDD